MAHGAPFPGLSAPRSFWRGRENSLRHGLTMAPTWPHCVGDLLSDVQKCWGQTLSSDSGFPTCLALLLGLLIS